MSIAISSRFSVPVIKVIRSVRINMDTSILVLVGLGVVLFSLAIKNKKATTTTTDDPPPPDPAPPPTPEPPPDDTDDPPPPDPAPQPEPLVYTGGAVGDYTADEVAQQVQAVYDTTDEDIQNELNDPDCNSGDCTNTNVHAASEDPSGQAFDLCENIIFYQDELNTMVNALNSETDSNKIASDIKSMGQYTTVIDNLYSQVESLGYHC